MERGRLTLIPATPALLLAELADPAQLGAALGAALPEDWPPGEYDRSAAEFFLARLSAGGPEAVGWYGWYAVHRATDDSPATLVAAAGYAGPPGVSGAVEIGYSVAAAWRGQGLATEL